MKGLDTNVLLRAVTNDDPVQSPIARRIIAALTPREPAYINVVVLCEFAWTLQRRYRYDRQQVGLAISAMLVSTAFIVAERSAVSSALTRSQDEELSFNDALIGELNLSAGCPATTTFDGQAAGTAAFVIAV